MSDSDDMTVDALEEHVDCVISFIASTLIHCLKVFGLAFLVSHALAYRPVPLPVPGVLCALLHRPVSPPVGPKLQLNKCSACKAGRVLIVFHGKTRAIRIPCF